MVLSFALCATLAFAQTNMTVKRADAMQNAAVKVSTETTDAGYKGSIFTKTAGDVLYSCTFEADPTTGTLGANDLVDGTAQGGNLAHSRNEYAGSWHRLTDTTAAYMATLVNNYPVFAGYYFTDNRNQPTDFSFRSATPTDGYMLMSMLEFIAQWGGNAQVGGYNAYFQLGPINTTTAPIINVRFYQFYKCFNNDKTYIDYSTDGSTWSAVEINVARVDMAVNANYRGYKTVTMPLACVGSASLSLRFRYACASDAQNGAYGYFWAVDDVEVIEGASNSFEVTSSAYFEGFYHLMPQGLQLPMVWNADFRNNGANTQTNVHGKIFTSDNRTSGYTAAVDVNYGSLASMADTSFLVDPKGWYAARGWGYLHGATPNQQPVTGPTAYLPTDNAGIKYVYANISSDNIAKIYGDTMTFDTIGYTVNALNEDNNAIWGRDNGVLAKFRYWTYGMVEQSTFSSDPDEVQYSAAGYRVWNSYITGNTIPTDANGQPWRIKGVQLVGSTYEGLAESDATIAATLIEDSTYLDGEDMYVNFKTIETGANTYTVQDDDLELYAEDFDVLTYKTFGNYRTIDINFPAQPVLNPSTAYRIGYMMAEDGNFCVANNSTYFYTLADSTATNFGEVAAMKAYGRTFGHNNSYTTMILDPAFASANGSYIRFLSVSSYPMIRMIVGPYTHVPQTTVSFTCGEHGAILNGAYENRCGQTDSVPQNSTMSFTFSPEEGYMVESIIIDGNEEFTQDGENEGDLSLSIPFGTAPVSIEATFMVDPNWEEGIDPVASNVNINLMPNPATSNVQLTINGVEGMVDYALIDMSGRVIRSAKMDAATSMNINLAGLAKGAYFVRIIANNTTKVEKLIVR